MRDLYFIRCTKSVLLNKKVYFCGCLASTKKVQVYHYTHTLNQKISYVLIVAKVHFFCETAKKCRLSSQTGGIKLVVLLIVKS